MDLRAAAFEHGLRCHVAQRAVQPLLVVDLYILCDETLSIVHRQRHTRPDTLTLNGLVPTLDFAVRLRVVRSSAHVRHTRHTDELFKVLGDELRPVIGNNTRPSVGESFFGALEENLDVGLTHRLAQPPVHYIAAGSIQDRAQIMKRAVNVDVCDIDMPVLMWRQWLLEPSTLLRRMARKTR